MALEEHRIQRIMWLFEAGNSYGAIAKIMNCSRSAVAGVICRNRKHAPDPSKVLHAWRYGAASSIVQAAREARQDEKTFRRVNGLDKP